MACSNLIPIMVRFGKTKLAEKAPTLSQMCHLPSLNVEVVCGSCVLIVMDRSCKKHGKDLQLCQRVLRDRREREGEEEEERRKEWDVRHGRETGEKINESNFFNGLTELMILIY